MWRMVRKLVKPVTIPEGTTVEVSVFGDYYGDKIVDFKMAKIQYSHKEFDELFGNVDDEFTNIGGEL